MKTKNKYLSPELDRVLIHGDGMFAASGNSTSVFDDGGSLPGWDIDGTATSSFLGGGSLPDYD